jgi:hypothetical protein
MPNYLDPAEIEQLLTAAVEAYQPDDSDNDCADPSLVPVRPRDPLNRNSSAESVKIAEEQDQEGKR